MARMNEHRVIFWRLTGGVISAQTSSTACPQGSAPPPANPREKHNYSAPVGQRRNGCCVPAPRGDRRRAHRPLFTLQVSPLALGEYHNRYILAWFLRRRLGMDDGQPRPPGRDPRVLPARQRKRLPLAFPHLEAAPAIGEAKAEAVFLVAILHPGRSPGAGPSGAQADSADQQEREAPGSKTLWQRRSLPCSVVGPHSIFLPIGETNQMFRTPTIRMVHRCDELMPFPSRGFGSPESFQPRTAYI